MIGRAEEGNVLIGSLSERISSGHNLKEPLAPVLRLPNCNVLADVDVSNHMQHSVDGMGSDPLT